MTASRGDNTSATIEKKIIESVIERRFIRLDREMKNLEKINDIFKMQNNSLVILLKNSL